MRFHKAEGGGEGSRLNKVKEELGTELECKICYDLMDEATSISPCFHTYCEKCITRHQTMDSRCPLCREDIEFTKKNNLIANIITTYKSHF